MVTSVRHLISCASYRLTQRLKSSRGAEWKSEVWAGEELFKKKTSLGYAKALGDSRWVCDQRHDQCQCIATSLSQFVILYTIYYAHHMGMLEIKTPALSKKGKEHIQACRLHSSVSFPSSPLLRESWGCVTISSCSASELGSPMPSARPEGVSWTDPSLNQRLALRLLPPVSCDPSRSDSKQIRCNRNLLADCSRTCRAQILFCSVQQRFYIEIYLAY